MTTNYCGARQLARIGCKAMLVTGASAGIGSALAVQLAAAGIQVVALARHRQRLEALEARNPGVIPLVCDLARVDGLADAAARALEACPALDGIIHNAAIQCDQRFDDADYGDACVVEELHTNLLAPLLLTRHLLASLQRRERAWVISIGSVLAAAPRGTAAVYSATKGAVDSFSRAMRLQSRGSGLNFVHAIMPLVDTAMTAGRGAGKISPETAADALLAAVAQGRREVYVGKARAVPWLQRFAPGLLAAMMARRPT